MNSNVTNPIANTNIRFLKPTRTDTSTNTHTNVSTDAETPMLIFTHYAHVAARASGASKHAGIQCDERKHQSGMIEEVAFFREDLGATLSLRRSAKHQMA